VLALALHMVCTPLRPGTGELFGGAAEATTFANFFAECVSKCTDRRSGVGDSGSPVRPDTSSGVNTLIGHRDYGTQSIRKGCQTHLTKFPGAANCLAGLLRAGYHLGGVLPKYVGQTVEGDQSTGRLLCGLPAQTCDHALLPPRFASPGHISFGVLLPDFESYPEQFKSCVPFLVASLVYHSSWLLEHLPHGHPLFISRFWRNGFNLQLARHVLAPVHMQCPVTGMCATGVSQLCAVLCSMASVPAAPPAVLAPTSGVRALSGPPAPSVESSSSEHAPLFTRAEVSALVQESVAQMQSGFAEQLDELKQILLRQNGMPTQSTQPPQLQLNQAVTSTFEYPTNLTLRQLYEIWYLGNPARCEPPLKTVKGAQVHLKHRQHVARARGVVSKFGTFLLCDAQQYFSAPPAQQDVAFHDACQRLCDHLLVRGYKSSKKDEAGKKSELLEKLRTNKYGSLYENVFKYLREPT
jgi:hypothetical protein